MKNLLTLICLIFILNAQAQSTFIKDQIAKKFFLQKGYELDFTTFPYYSANGTEELSSYNQWQSAGLNLNYIFRFNILEIDSDQAISISTAPALGISFSVNQGQASYNFNNSYTFSKDVFGIGNLNFPIEFNYHIGKGATKYSTNKYGLNFSFGKEWRMNPLLIWADLPEYKIGLKKLHSGYIIKLGLVREKKKIHEVYIRTVIFNIGQNSFFNYVPFPTSGNFSLGLRL